MIACTNTGIRLPCFASRRSGLTSVIKSKYSFPPDCASCRSCAIKPALTLPSFAFPSLESHLNWTGFKELMKSKPTGKSIISFLSLLSDNELIEDCWHLRVVILLSPKTNS